jgi:hypothetical protein
MRVKTENIIKKKHKCINHRVYLDPCDDCIDKERECELSTNGICSICGEIIK